MEINAEQNLLWEAKFRRQKIGWDKNKFGELSAEEIQEITDNVVAVKTNQIIKFGMRIFNGTYPLSLFPLKVIKFHIWTSRFCAFMRIT